MMERWSDYTPRQTGRANVIPWPEIAGEIARPARRRSKPVPRVKVRGNEEVPVPIRVLAARLGRSSQTIREWEWGHLFPPAPFRSDSTTRHGERRLYPPSYVDGVVAIAREEDIIERKATEVRMDRFSKRVWALFLESGFNAPLPDGRRRG